MYAREVFESLRPDMPKITCGEVERMATSARECGGLPRPPIRATPEAQVNDACIERLKKLRDYYRQTSQPREVKAIKRAIDVLREMM